MTRYFEADVDVSDRLFNDSPNEAQVLPYDGTATLHLDAFTPERADEMFKVLLTDLAWQEHLVFVFGRWVAQPRLTAWYGDTGRQYRYSGINLEPHPWIPLLEEIRTICGQLAATSFNSVLANLYRDGRDGVAWHADDEPELGINPTIASVSLGAERRFDLRHRMSGETIRLHLPSGSVLVMTGPTQHYWKHQISKTAKRVGHRINLTYRWIHE